MIILLKLYLSEIYISVTSDLINFSYLLSELLRLRLYQMKKSSPSCTLRILADDPPVDAEEEPGPVDLLL